MQQESYTLAEALYLAFEDPDAALHMWHSLARYDEAVALVARVRPVRLCILYFLDLCCAEHALEIHADSC